MVASQNGEPRRSLACRYGMCQATREICDSGRTWESGIEVVPEFVTLAAGQTLSMPM
jgi:hypothetical protein